MKKLTYFILFLIFFMILNCISTVIGQFEEEEEYDPTTVEGSGLEGGRYREYITRMEDTLKDGGVVDFSQEPYASNPELVLEALKEKYPNLDLNSIDGVKIDGNTLTTSDNSKIDLTTGKPITVETDGNKVTYFDDGSGTTIVNAVGVEYKAGILKVELADRVN